MSEFKRVNFVGYRVSYIVLRGCWCNVYVLNVLTSSEEKSYDSKDGFDEELEQVFDHFPKSIHPLGDTALGETWPPQQPVSIALCQSSFPSTALSSLLSSML